MLMEEARAMAIRQGREIDAELTQRMEKGSYMDDNISSGTTQEIDHMIGNILEIQGELHYSGTIARVFAEVGMRPKVKVRSGETDPDPIERLGGAMLGYSWDPSLDVIVIRLHVNISKKKFGARTSPNLTEEECGSIQDMLTLRTVTAVVASIYDPLSYCQV